MIESLKQMIEEGRLPGDVALQGWIIACWPGFRSPWPSPYGSRM
ncbi:MAG: hypothetical protein R6U78_13980 [Bacteroidales bacterium]